MSPRRRLIGVLATVLAFAGCIGAPSPAGTGAASGSAGGTALTVGLGFIPSVQFAPFYLADRAGYYRDAGLGVTFQNRIDPDLITLVGQGTIDVGLADGTSVIPAVANGIPIRYVATVYGRFPSIVFAKASAGIESAADLEGRKLGIPGRFGSSWIMLQALLGSADLTPDDLEITEYPDFTQGAAVRQGAVDAATGFANNEPVQLEQAGEAVTVLRIDDVVALPGPGLISGTATLDGPRREAVRGFVAATLRAMDEIAADPDLGLDAAIAAVPELGQDRELQRAILDATIETWQGDATRERGFGAIDREGWQASVGLLRELGVVSRDVPVDELVREDLVPPRG